MVLCVLCETIVTCQEVQNKFRKLKLFALYAERLRTFGVFWVTQRSQRHAKKNKTLCETLRALRDLFTCQERQNKFIKSKPFALYAEELRTLGVLWVTQRSQRHAKKAFSLCGTLRALRDLFYTPGTYKHTKKTKTSGAVCRATAYFGGSLGHAKIAKTRKEKQNPLRNFVEENGQSISSPVKTSQHCFSQPEPIVDRQRLLTDPHRSFFHTLSRA